MERGIPIRVELATCAVPFRTVEVVGVNKLNEIASCQIDKRIVELENI